MSAFMHNNSLFDDLISYALNNKVYFQGTSFQLSGDNGLINEGWAQNAARTLLFENAASVQHRYKDQDCERPLDRANNYHFVKNEKGWVGNRLLVIVNMTRSLIYQSCERDTYYNSDAYKIAKSIQDHASIDFMKLHGLFDAEGWG